MVIFLSYDQKIWKTFPFLKGLGTLLKFGISDIRLISMDMPTIILFNSSNRILMIKAIEMPHNFVELSCLGQKAITL